MLFGTNECGVSGENQVAGKGLKGNYLIRFKWDVNSDPDLAIERGALLDRQDIDRITASLQNALKKALPDFPGDDYLIATRLSGRRWTTWSGWFRASCQLR